MDNRVVVKLLALPGVSHVSSLLGEPLINFIRERGLPEAHLVLQNIAQGYEIAILMVSD